MKRLKIIGMTLAILILPLAVSAQTTFEIAVGAWYVNPDGDLAFSPDGTTTSLDLEDRFGYDSEWEPMIRAKIEPEGLAGFYLKATPMGFDSTEDNSFEFAIGDTVFGADDRIDSEFFLNIWDAALYLSTPFIETGPTGGIDLDVGVGARYITLEADVERIPVDDDFIEGDVLEQNPDESVIYPMIFAALEMQPADMVSVEVEGWGMAISNDQLYSVSGLVKLMPFGGPFMITGGYRAEFLNIDKGDMALDSNFTGPFAEVGLKF